MNTYELVMPGLAHISWQAARWELFVVPGVRDVGPGEQQGTVLVRYEGEPAPSTWLRTLVEAGLVPG